MKFADGDVDGINMNEKFHNAPILRANSLLKYFFCVTLEL